MQPFGCTAAAAGIPDGSLDLSHGVLAHGVLALWATAVAGAMGCDDDGMKPGPPLAHLPEAVTFTLDEVADILFAVDLAVGRTRPGGAEHATSRRVQRLITTRLWPDLGALLDDDRDGDG